MTKKNIFLILILVVFFSVMAISIWGKNPDKSGVIPATGITFYNQDGVEVTEISPNDGDKPKLISLKRNDEEKTDMLYRFSLVLSPEDTTDTVVTWKYMRGEEPEIEEIITPDTYISSSSTPVVDPSSSTAPKHSIKYMYSVHFLYEQQQKATKLDFEYNKVGGSTKHAYLTFSWSGGTTIQPM